jgi:hypothetical protein
MNNGRGYAEAYKDVIHEDAIKIGSDSARPAGRSRNDCRGRRA